MNKQHEEEKILFEWRDAAMVSLNGEEMPYYEWLKMVDGSAPPTIKEDGK